MTTLAAQSTRLAGAFDLETQVVWRREEVTSSAGPIFSPGQNPNSAQAPPLRIPSLSITLFLERNKSALLLARLRESGVTRAASTSLGRSWPEPAPSQRI